MPKLPRLPASAVITDLQRHGGDTNVTGVVPVHRRDLAVGTLGSVLNGTDLAKQLRQFGCSITRQSGSHMRLTRIAGGQGQHLTIPAHKPLRVGTLRQILKDVADHTHQTLGLVLEAFG